MEQMNIQEQSPSHMLKNMFVNIGKQNRTRNAETIELLDNIFIKMLHTPTHTNTMNQETYRTGLQDLLFYNELVTMVKLIFKFKRENRRSSSYRRVLLLNNFIFNEASKRSKSIAKLSGKEREIFDNVSHAVLMMMSVGIIDLGLDKVKLKELKELVHYDRIVSVGVRGGYRTGQKGGVGSDERLSREYIPRTRSLVLYEEDEEDRSFMNRMRVFFRFLFSGVSNYGDVLLLLIGIYILYFTFLNINDTIQSINIPITTEPEIGTEVVEYGATLPSIEPIRVNAGVSDIINWMSGIDGGRLTQGIIGRITDEFAFYAVLAQQELQRVASETLYRETQRVIRESREVLVPSENVGNMFNRIGATIVNTISAFNSRDVLLENQRQQATEIITRITQDTQNYAQLLTTRFMNDIQRRSHDAIRQTTTRLQVAASSLTLGYTLAITGLTARVARLLRNRTNNQALTRFDNRTLRNGGYGKVKKTKGRRGGNKHKKKGGTKKNKK